MLLKTENNTQLSKKKRDAIMKNGFSFFKLAVFAQPCPQEGGCQGVWELHPHPGAAPLKHYTGDIWHMSDSLIRSPLTNKIRRKLNQTHSVKNALKLLA